MCNPVLAVMAVTVAVSAYAAYSSQKSQNAAMEYNAKIAEQNQKTSELMAQEAEDQGERDLAQQARQVAQFKGQQRSAFAASGVELEDGTAADVLKQTDLQAREDALTMRYNAAKDAWGYRVQGSNYQAQANLSRMQKRNPWETAGTTALTTGSSLGSQYAMQKAG